MGTRSLTYVYDELNPVVCMYRQYDGYPSGHGKELAEFLNGGELVNGLGSNDTKVFNGMGCLAAQMVANFKDGPGGFYLREPVLNRDDWQEYEYHVFETKVVVRDPKDVIFDGTWKEFSDFCLKADQLVAKLANVCYTDVY